MAEQFKVWMHLERVDLENDICEEDGEPEELGSFFSREQAMEFSDEVTSAIDRVKRLEATKGELITAFKAALSDADQTGCSEELAVIDMATVKQCLAAIAKAEGV
jgi:hypothetical protein